MTMIAMLMSIALAAGSSNIPATGSAADSVLSRYVEALGGRAALERIEARSYRGTLIHDITWHEPQHEEIPFAADHRGKGTFRCVEGADPAALQDAQPEDEDGKLDWLLHPRGALAVAEYFPDLEITGREVRDGRETVVLESPHLPTSYWALYFDVETGLLSHIGYYWDLQDYRDAGGVLFPHRIATSRKGGSSTYVFEEVVTEISGR